ncbi:hypothetical protein L210DRAFT_3652205 [Boletus edulis BED1]|uniref:Uncharacterized protein n=1 Tax=Boletus edulis BED1 TaxID=1328754 RepID=A0AAD4G970_BOLED|nr:hypothetical protein L210DRAFT_3652205 [Boletus edulis BED1]
MISSKGYASVSSPTTKAFWREHVVSLFRMFTIIRSQVIHAKLAVTIYSPA